LWVAELLVILDFQVITRNLECKDSFMCAWGIQIKLSPQDCKLVRVLDDLLPLFWSKEITIQRSPQQGVGNCGESKFLVASQEWTLVPYWTIPRRYWDPNSFFHRVFHILRISGKIIINNKNIMNILRKFYNNDVCW